MSTERERRQARQREKDRKRDAARARERTEQRREAARAAAAATPGAPVAVTPAEASRWPAVEAWIGEAWDDPSATVPGVLVRSAGDGRWACAAFRYDPARGLVDPRALLGVPEGAVRRPVVDFAEDKPLIACEPGDVAQLLRKARRITTSLPDGGSPVLDLLDGIDPDDAALDVDPPPKPPKPPPAPGLFERLRARLWG